MSITTTTSVAAELDAATVRYGPTVALAPTSLTIDAGSAVALVGPNGSGKSTLLHLLAGLVEPTAGTVTSGLGSVALVAQHQRHHGWMPLAGADVVRMGRYGHRGLLGRIGAADRAAIDRGVERMGVGDLLGAPFGTLSGGQQQRLLLAQALAAEADLLLLDEPITGLDLVSQRLILEVIDEEVARGTAVVFSTHHLGEARRAQRVILLAGRVVADGSPAEVLRPELLVDAFGARMVHAADDGTAPIGVETPDVVVFDEHGHDCCD